MPKTFHFRPVRWLLGIGIVTALAGNAIQAQQAGSLSWGVPLNLPATTPSDPGAIVQGEKAIGSSKGAVAIGNGAVATGQPGIAHETASETVAIGEQSQAQGWRCTAIGAKAKAGVVSATAIGRGAYAWGPHMVAIGRGAYMEQIRISPYLRDGNACGLAGEHLYLGGMMAHRTVDRTGDSEVIPTENGGDGKARWDVRTVRPKNYTIHGMDAFDARFVQEPGRFDASKYDASKPETWQNKPDIDVPGGDITLAAGRGSGIAPGGSLLLQTAPAGDKSENNKNPLKTAMKLDTDYQTPQATPMWLWDNDAKQLKRVLVGPADSGGKGFRALIIEN